MIQAQATCAHVWDIYKGKLGVKNWCPLCGKIKLASDNVIEIRDEVKEVDGDLRIKFKEAKALYERTFTI